NDRTTEGQTGVRALPAQRAAGSGGARRCQALRARPSPALRVTATCPRRWSSGESGGGRGRVSAAGSGGGPELGGAAGCERPLALGAAGGGEVGERLLEALGGEVALAEV